MVAGGEAGGAKLMCLVKAHGLHFEGCREAAETKSHGRNCALPDVNFLLNSVSSMAAGLEQPKE